MNADGDYDAGTDVLKSGWSIYAYADENGDGNLDTGEDLIATDVTDANGVYSFSLTPGKYIIVEEDRAGWSQSEPTTDVVDTSTEAVAQNGYAITLTSGETESGNDFGNYQLPKGS